MTARILEHLGTSLLLLAAVGGAFAAHEWFARKPFFPNHFYDRTFLQFVLRSPEQLTTLGLLEAIGVHGHNARWDDASPAAREDLLDFVERVSENLALYGDDELTDDERLAREIVRELIGDVDELRRFRFHDYPVDPLTGVHVEIPRFLDSDHRVRNARDAEHYLARLDGIDEKFAQVLEGLRVREERGIVPPTFVIDRSLQTMRRFVATPPRENLLYTSYAAKLEGTPEVGPERSEAFLSRAEAAIVETVYPAWRRCIDYPETLRASSTREAGVWKLPDGAAYYAHLLRRHTTTALTAGEIHRIGLAEVDRLREAILRRLAQAGFDPSADFADALAQWKADPRFYYPDTDEGRARMLADYRNLLEEIAGGLERAFHARPRAALEVRRVPEFAEQTQPPAYYRGPSGDGTRPGVFYANLGALRAMPRYRMHTVAYHEGIPGHHFQIAMQRDLAGVPQFRREFTFGAYREGWALYAEQLAWELGFQKDPLDDVGRLQDELVRAARLVVDTGIHARRWTREEAIDYMRAHTGMAESVVIAEVERYVVLPAQATAYKVGMLEILRLREEAREALGDHFDLRDFHAVVLGDGALPLHLLRDQVQRYSPGH